MFALGSIFNCCTALGKSSVSDPPVTSIKECPPPKVALIGGRHQVKSDANERTALITKFNQGG